MGVPPNCRRAFFQEPSRADQILLGCSECRFTTINAQNLAEHLKKSNKCQNAKIVCKNKSKQAHEGIKHEEDLFGGCSTSTPNQIDSIESSFISNVSNFEQFVAPHHAKKLANNKLTVKHLLGDRDRTASTNSSSLTNASSFERESKSSFRSVLDQIQSQLSNPIHFKGRFY